MIFICEIITILFVIIDVFPTNIRWFEVANFWRPFCFIDSYQIYLNGLIIQWGNTVSNYDTAIQMPVSFSNMDNYFVTASSVDEIGRSYHMVVKVDANHIKVYDMVFGDSWGVLNSKMTWFAIGY